MQEASFNDGPCPTRILVVGAGAVGCFYGSRLHDQSRNVQVSLVCRSNYHTISFQNGVLLTTRSFGDYLFSPEHIFSSIRASTEIRWDYVVIATKAFPGDEERVAELLQTSPLACVVLIQNGLGVEEPYRRRFGEGLVLLSAVTIVSAEQLREGTIKQNRWTRISVGPYTDGKTLDEKSLSHLVGMQKAEAFVKLLTDGGIKDADLHSERELQTIRWHKIAINAAMNSSAVLSHGAPNATMVKDPDLDEHIRGCMSEVFRAAEVVLGRSLLDERSGLKLATIDAIIRSTERNEGGRPSMLVDWEKGAKMELEVILGNPLRLAKEKGIEMPRLQAMYALLKMAQKRRDDEQSPITSLKSNLQTSKL